MQNVCRRDGNPRPGGVHRAATPPFRIWPPPQHSGTVRRRKSRSSGPIPVATIVKATRLVAFTVSGTLFAGFGTGAWGASWLPRLVQRSSPLSPVKWAMYLRVVTVSGWRGPKTCSWSGSSSWYRRSATIFRRRPQRLPHMAPLCVKRGRFPPWRVCSGPRPPSSKVRLTAAAGRRWLGAAGTDRRAGWCRRRVVGGGSGK
jgi:hypothetical protein